jgi:hypothetical protein
MSIPGIHKKDAVLIIAIDSTKDLVMDIDRQYSTDWINFGILGSYCVAPKLCC